MKKSDRQIVFNKFGGRCAYCGNELPLKGWHCDHIDPIMRGYTQEQAERAKFKKGSDDIENKYPACRRCNLWKGAFTVERFRQEIREQPVRINRDVAGYRLAKAFGLIGETDMEVTFYFEDEIFKTNGQNT